MPFDPPAVIVLDGNPEEREETVLFLSRRVDNVIVDFGGSRAAKDWCSRHPGPKVVLLDINLPEEDAFDFMDACRSCELAEKCRTVVLTGREITDRLRGKMNRAGVLAFIEKPLSQTGLKTAFAIANHALYILPKKK